MGDSLTDNKVYKVDFSVIVKSEQTAWVAAPGPDEAVEILKGAINFTENVLEFEVTSVEKQDTELASMEAPTNTIN